MPPFLLFALFFSFSIAFNMLGPLVTNIMATTGMSLTECGSLLSSQQLGAIGTMALMFIFQKRMKQSTLMTSGYIAIIIAFLGITINQHIFIIFAGYIVLGVGSFLVDSGTNSFIASAYFSKRALYIPLLHFMYSVGAIITGYIILPFKSPSWPYAYMSVALVLLIFITMFIISSKNTHRRPLEDKEQGPTKELLKDPAFILYTLVIMFYMGIQIICSTWIPVYVETELHQSALMTSTSLTAFWVGIALSRLIIGPILNKGAKPFTLSIWGMVFSALSLIIATSLSIHIGSVLFFTFLCGFFAGSTIPMYIVVVSTWYPNNTTFISLSYILSGTIGRMIFPFLVTVIASSTSLSFSLSLSSILFLLGALFILIVKRLSSKRPSYSHV
ncbi:MAG: MFS transporter [Spirochaetia bacterium]|nr:MFS transporter [Spirochaetia bacterium]